MIQTPYLRFPGDAADPLAAKVAQDIPDWRPDWRPDYAVGQFRMAGCMADMRLPDMTLDQARAAGVKTVVISVANRVGVISKAWIKVLVAALEAGFDLASGLHNLLRDEPELTAAAARTGRSLHNVRVPSVDYPIGNGVKRTGTRLLAVGTGCSCGKMDTTLAPDAEMRRRGLKSSFRATGQAGILITGGGVPLDAAVADFMAGAVEWLTPDNDADHCDRIEGQGSLVHVSYSGVTLALIHGGQPDALVICHEPTRHHMRGLPGDKLPTMEPVRDMALTLALTLARVANPACVAVGVSINTQPMADDAAATYLSEVEARRGLPAVDPFCHDPFRHDPFRHGAGRGGWPMPWRRSGAAPTPSLPARGRGHVVPGDAARLTAEGAVPAAKGRALRIKSFPSPLCRGGGIARGTGRICATSRLIVGPLSDTRRKGPKAPCRSP